MSYVNNVGEVNGKMPTSGDESGRELKNMNIVINEDVVLEDYEKNP